MFSRATALAAGMIMLLWIGQARAFFTDTGGTRYADAYAFLEERGVVYGFADGTGRPHAPINRVEALKTVLEANPRYAERLSWYRAHLPRLPLFFDADQSAWYAPYIETAFEAGLITGYPDRTFRPGRPVTAEEAVALVLRAAGSKAAPADGAWYQKDIENAAAKHLIAHEETMYLGERLTRGQFFDMVYRMRFIQEKKIAAFPLSPGAAARPVLAARPAPVAQMPPPASGTRVTQFAISIPVLGIENIIVTHPTDAVTSKGLLAPLQYGLGHLFGYPGGGAKIMVYGHSSSTSYDVSQFTKIFRRVNELQPGDRVYVSYDNRQFVYEVTRQQTIAPHDTSPFSGQGEELILFTCWPPDSTATRLLVHAAPVQDVALARE